MASIKKTAHQMSLREGSKKKKNGNEDDKDSKKKKRKIKNKKTLGCADSALEIDI